jgi:hypothetical protein
MSKQLRMQARAMAERYGVDPILFEKMIEQESNFDVDAYNADTDAVGLGQIVPLTALDPGFGVKPIENRKDPIENLRFSAQYLKAMLDKFGTYPLALAAYNAGPGKVMNAGNQVPNFPETKNYVRNIMAGYKGGQVDPRLYDANEKNVSRETDGKLGSAPMARPSNLGQEGGGISATQRNQILKMIENMNPVSKAPPLRPEGLRTIPQATKMSPLSKMGIPGVGNIAKYSAPGGVASLMNRNKKTETI